MAAPTKLFLDYNSFDSSYPWKVLDQEGKVFGSGEIPEDAIKSARIVTNAPIYANSQFKGLIEGEPLLDVRYLEDIDEETVLYGSEEIMEAMAELGGFKVYKVYDDRFNRFVMGYSFEVVE